MPARTIHDGEEAAAEIDWIPSEKGVLTVNDPDEVTEHGAEAIALAYVHVTAGWSLKRRLRRGESADWLLANKRRRLALEVSGTTGDDASNRFKQKLEQTGKCTLAKERLAIVVAFGGPVGLPLILVGTV